MSLYGWEYIATDVSTLEHPNRPKVAPHRLIQQLVVQTVSSISKAFKTQPI